MRTADLTGQDLAYWTARANANGRNESMVRRRNYGAGQSRHEPINEPSMRAFVAHNFGDNLPARDAWL